ncbi:MAG: sugar ABC transporter permease [Candidatus Limivivens sp.]|nr:sugar ABC transporter permease [Candidatus Limivivens sp.]
MAASSKAKKASSGKIKRYDYNGYKFVFPAVLIMAALIVYPMLYGGYLSFFNTNLVTKWKFVGFKYYMQAFTQSEFYNSVLLTFAFMILVVAGHFIIGFILASVLNKKFVGRTIFRVIFMLPWLFPETVIALLFTWIMNPMYGILNSILKSLGIISSNISWLGSASLAFPSVVAVCIWKGYPMVMTMILSGLQGISSDLYEAAMIDGANKWQQFLHVTIPGLKPVMTTTIILDSVWWFKQYTLVYTMTGGGPGTATNLISLNIYGTAFNDLRFGKAAAWGIIVFVICYLISKIYRMVLKDD